VKLEWTGFALADRNAIFDFIEAESPRSAVFVDDTIKEQVQQVILFPESGRPGRVAGTRELMIRNLPYVIAYRVNDETVRILRVLHTAQQWPDDLPQ
jgi:addiction module RelE/StbE family toxin